MLKVLIGHKYYKTKRYIDFCKYHEEKDNNLFKTEWQDLVLAVCLWFIEFETLKTFMFCKEKNWTHISSAFTNRP